MRRQKAKSLDEVKLEILSNIIENTYKQGEEAWNPTAMRQLNQFFGLADRYSKMYFRDIGLDNEISPFERIYVGYPYDGVSIKISSYYKQISLCFYDPQKSIGDLYDKLLKKRDTPADEGETTPFIEQIDEVFGELSWEELGFQYAYVINNKGGIYTTESPDVVAGYHELKIEEK